MSNLHEFIVAPLGGTLWRHTCQRCGGVFDKPSPKYWAICPMAPDAPPRIPPLHQRLANFARAAIAHELAGSPTCTQEQIDERHAVCVACELYRPDKDNRAIGHCCHETCGCPITQLGRYVSKLAWADQKCPLDKWPAIQGPAS